MTGPGGTDAGPDQGELWFGNDHPALEACWHPVAALDALHGDGPHPVRLLGRDLVLFRSGPDRDWALLPDRCPHRLAPLSAGTVEDGRLRCPYHGWCFDDDGACVEIPALGPGARIPPAARLRAAAAVAERFGLVWAALEPPVAPLPEVAEWDDPAFGRATLPLQDWRASAGQMTDNFLDVAHFPFTHVATIGDPDELTVGDCQVEHHGWSFTARYHHSSKVLDGSGRVVQRSMEFTCTAPHHLRLRLDYADEVVVLAFFHQPVDRATTRLHAAELTTGLAADPSGADQVIAFQMAVAGEDRALLEQLRADAVPLHPGAEVHTRADRTTVAYRRQLLDLVAATSGGTPEPTSPGATAP